MIEPLIQDKVRTHNKCLMTKYAEDSEHYKEANRIMKVKVNKRKNRLWEMKCRDSMVGSLRSTEVS
jgi:hypothetical protein